MWFMKVPSQFSVGQTAQSLTCSIMEKPYTGLDECLNMLLSCFRKRISDLVLCHQVLRRDVILELHVLHCDQLQAAPQVAVAAYAVGQEPGDGVPPAQVRVVEDGLAI